MKFRQLPVAEGESVPQVPEEGRSRMKTSWLNNIIAVFCVLLTGITLAHFEPNPVWEFVYHFREGFVTLAAFVFIYTRLEKNNYVATAIVLYAAKTVFEVYLFLSGNTPNETKHVFWWTVLIGLTIISLQGWDKYRTLAARLLRTLRSFGGG